MNYIDFAIAVSIFLFFFTMVLILSTNYFSNISGLTKISEFRSVAEGVFKLLFGGKGVPENWEKTSSLNPVQLGLIEDLYRIPVLVKETSGYNRTNELVSVNLVFDEDCENKAWNDSVRVFDENGDEISYRLFDEGFCSSQFLKEAKVAWEINISANQKKKFYVYYSPDDSISPPNYTDTFSTVLYLPFDEGSGTTTTDMSGNRNDGTLYNGSVVCADPPTAGCLEWVDGKFSNALKFDGSNDYVNISDSPSLRVDKEITMELWFKTDVAESFNFLVEREDTAGNYLWGLYLTTLSRASQVYIRNSSGDVNGVGVFNPSGYNDSTWHHFVGTFDGRYIKLYMDGQLQNTEDWGFYTDISADPGITYVGAWIGNNQFFPGTIDEVRIYNRALSYEEINISYNFAFVKVKPFPEENFDVLSSSKINALKKLSYEEILKTLGGYKFRIEISEIE